MEVEIVETTEKLIDNSHVMGQAGQITLIGILILYISLLILWGVMEIIVRVIKDPEKAEVIEEVEAEIITPVVEMVDENVLKMQAAAAAVASIQNYDLKMQVAAAAAGYVAAKKES